MTEDMFMLQKNMHKMFDGISEFKIIFSGSEKKQMQSVINIIE